MLTDAQYNAMLENLARLIEATAGKQNEKKKSRTTPVEDASNILDTAGGDCEDRYATILDTLSLLVESQAKSVQDAAQIVRDAKTVHPDNNRA